MKTFVASFAFAVAVLAAPFVSAADRGVTSTLPAPLHLMNFSPSFASYSGDLTLWSGSLAETVKAHSGTLTFVAKSPVEGAETRRVEVINRANAENFRFDARLPAQALGVRLPQGGTLYFTPSTAWTFKKTN